MAGIINLRENARQTRNRLRAQEALPTATATGLFLSQASDNSLFWSIASATTAATATALATVSLITSVTATGNAVTITWASVATEFSRVELAFFGIQTATAGAISARTSTDGVSFDSAATHYNQSVALANATDGAVSNSGILNLTASEFNLTATGGASIRPILATGVAQCFSGRLQIFNADEYAGDQKVIGDFAYDGVGGTASGPTNLRLAGARAATMRVGALEIFNHDATGAFINGLIRAYGFV